MLPSFSTPLAVRNGCNTPKTDEVARPNRPLSRCNELLLSGMRQNLAHEAGQRFAGNIVVRDPAHSGGRGGAGGHACRVGHKLEREMREGVAHNAWDAAPGNSAF